MRLHELPTAQMAVIDKVDWEALSPSEVQRLKEFGVDEGATIEPLHRGLFGRGALACRIGRMTIAMRHQHADAIHVRTGDAGAQGGGRAQGQAASEADRIAAE